jgi:murein DD-endopeptidase MepM/ murein hydrolase activator NlpD
LGQIALDFGTTVEAIAGLNGILDPDRIFVGQVLEISGNGDPGGTFRTAPVGHVFPVKGFTGRVNLHHGVHEGASDLFAPKGTPVLVMNGGRVTHAGTESTDRFGGNNVLIKADDGLTYYYAHGDRPPAMGVGQRVETGEFIFGVGDTGNARGTGDHLHIGIGHGIQDGVGPAGGAGINFNAVELMRSTPLS